MNFSGTKPIFVDLSVRGFFDGPLGKSTSDFVMNWLKQCSFTGDESSDWCLVGSAYDFVVTHDHCLDVYLRT